MFSRSCYLRLVLRFHWRIHFFFWWSMHGAWAMKGRSIFRRSSRIRRTAERRQAELRSKHIGEPQDKLDIYDNSFFNARWTVHVLNRVFGLDLKKAFSDEGRDMTFTAYNDSGLDKNRFSWTLGTATLIASENHKGLE